MCVGRDRVSRECDVITYLLNITPASKSILASGAFFSPEPAEEASPFPFAGFFSSAPFFFGGMRILCGRDDVGAIEEIV